jgi:hypothetical protein
MATPLEKDIEKALGRMVGRLGGLCLKWVCPGWAGVPDRIILLPGGQILFVELKRPKGGQLAPMQIWWSRKLLDLGFHHTVIWSFADLKALEEVLVGRLREVLSDD